MKTKVTQRLFQPRGMGEKIARAILNANGLKALSCETPDVATPHI